MWNLPIPFPLVPPFVYLFLFLFLFLPNLPILSPRRRKEGRNGARSRLPTHACRNFFLLRSKEIPHQPGNFQSNRRQSRLFFFPPNPFPCALFPPSLLVSRRREREGKRKKEDSQTERTEEMCPLRVILIFLSATVAGFFLARGLNADPADHFDADADGKGSPRAPVPLHSKVGSAVKTGFWTMVDMASGRYLWRTLVAQPAKSDSDKAQ